MFRFDQNQPNKWVTSPGNVCVCIVYIYAIIKKIEITYAVFACKRLQAL